MNLLRRLKEAKPARLLERPDSPTMYSLWDGRYTVADSGRLLRWLRGALGLRARRAEYVVAVSRMGRARITFRLENSSSEVVGEIHLDETYVFKGMTYRELAARAATVMLADLAG